MIYCTDIDLLKWEPNLFRDVSFAGQKLLAGTGTLAGTSFALSTGSFLSSHVAEGMVIVLDGTVKGSYPIVRVEDVMLLTLTVLYDGILPSPAGQADAVPFSIHTFSPQAQLVSAMLDFAAGVDEKGAILNPAVLRRACILGTLQLIYNALAASGQETTRNSARADLYQRLYRRAVNEARVEVDPDGLGQRKVVRALNVRRFERV